MNWTTPFKNLTQCRVDHKDHPFASYDDHIINAHSFCTQGQCASTRSCVFMRVILDLDALLAAVQKLLNDLLILTGLKDATDLLLVIKGDCEICESERHKISESRRKRHINLVVFTSALCRFKFMLKLNPLIVVIIPGHLLRPADQIASIRLIKAE